METLLLFLLLTQLKIEFHIPQYMYLSLLKFKGNSYQNTRLLPITYWLSATVLKKGKNFSCTNQKYVTRTCIVVLQLCRAYKKTLMMIDWIICVYFTICTLTFLPISGFLLDDKSLQNLPNLYNFSYENEPKVCINDVAKTSQIKFSCQIFSLVK